MANSKAEVMKLAYFNQRTAIRVSSELKDRIDKLLSLYPVKYESMSQVIRAAVIRLYNQEVDLNGNKKAEDIGFEYL